MPRCGRSQLRHTPFSHATTPGIQKERTSEALRHLAAEVGVSQFVIGTDHPIPWQAHAVDPILNAPGFTDEERWAM